MSRLPRARTAAPVVHGCLFVVASALLWTSGRPVLDGPARFPTLLFWVADIPISLIASGQLFFSNHFAWLVWGLWGVIGTIWWYFLGLSIEALLRRSSSRRAMDKR